MVPSSEKRFRTAKFQKILKVLLFVLSALLVVYFLPREGKFKYTFNQGKPWRYGLLTAPFDFPIYKTDLAITQERDSALKSFRPYFQILPQTEEENLQRLTSHYRKIEAEKKIPRAYFNYVVEGLHHVYSKGILSVADYNTVFAYKDSSVFVMEDRKASFRHVKNLFTVRSAYNEIFNRVPSHIDKKMLQELDINNYLSINMETDAKMSNKAKAEILQQLSETEGMVQSGERIIDRGEIVSSSTFNILRSLQKSYDVRGGSLQNRWLVISGEILLIAILFSLFYLFMIFFRRRTYNVIKNVILLLTMTTFFILLTEFSIRYDIGNEYVIPFAMLPIILSTFFDSRLALYAHIILTMLCSVMVRFPFEFLFLQIAAGMTAVLVLKDLTERSQLFRSALLIFIVYCLTYTGISLFQEGSFEKINYKMYFYFGINGILLLFAYLFIFVLEKVFGMISGVTLVELSNINSPLLREFSEKCPGTFQHSMQVSNLATAAASKIGANAQLVRTGALYHDIGKMKNPSYFVENQSSINTHKDENLIEAAKKVISHVSEGLKIAEKEKLPNSIKDFIKTHHGKNKTLYFYNLYKNNHPDQVVDDTLFTYPGPNPNSKETAVLMMADVVEAASRSLPEITVQTLNDLVERLIDTQIASGVFKESPLSFRDAEDVKEVFKEKLRTIYHSRMTYPELTPQENQA